MDNDENKTIKQRLTWVLSKTYTSGVIIFFLGGGRILPSVIWRCWLGGRKGIRPVKTEWSGAGVVIWLERGADLHMAQLMPLPLTVSCFSKIQIGFTFLVPADPEITGKGPLNGSALERGRDLKVKCNAVEQV